MWNKIKSATKFCKELLEVIWIYIVIYLLIFLGVYLFNVNQCNQASEIIGKETFHKFSVGCFVKTNKGNIPYENYKGD